MLFPVEVSGNDPRAAAMLQEQFGGANGELTALLQYFTQSFGTVDPVTRQLLLNVAVEEASHLEMVGTAIVQLMAMDATPYNAAPMLKPSMAATGQALVDAPSLLHKLVDLGGVGPLVADSSGAPFTGSYVKSTGDVVANLTADIAAEQGAGQVYFQLRSNIQDPGLKRTLEFLEEREATHSALFSEALERVKDLGIAKKQGHTVLAHRPPALSRPYDKMLEQLQQRASGEPLRDPIAPHLVEVQLAEADERVAQLV